MIKENEDNTEELYDFALKLQEMIYNINLAGGPLQIVLDEGGIENKDIQLCIDEFIPVETNTLLKHLCFALADVLLKLPKDYREFVVGGMGGD